MTAPVPAEAPLTICLFGPFEAHHSGAALPRLRSHKGPWLLALLALRHGREVERDWLAGTLWPESAPAQAFHNLRVTLSDLRRALGPEACRLRSPTRRTVSLELAAADVDVLTFDTAIRQGDEASLAEAVRLYRGPLLEGCVEEWAFQERQAREQAYLTALEELAALALARGEAAAAERSLRWVVAADPLRESAQRSLMEVLAAGGNYAAALLVYRELRLRLHRELNAEPDSETQSLFQQLRAEAREKASASHLARSTGYPPPARAVGGAGNGNNGRDPLTTPRLALGAEVHRREGGLTAASPAFLSAGGEDITLAGEERPKATQKGVAVPHNLPLHLTPFFGRETEIGRLCHWFDSPLASLETRRTQSTTDRKEEPSDLASVPLRDLCVSSEAGGDFPRLVTLTGPGGSGKTRLALEMAHALREGLDSAVCFVALADLTDSRLLPERVRDALGLPRAPDLEPLEQVVAFLSSRVTETQPLLLLLDNFEQLLAPVPEPGEPGMSDGAAIVWRLLERVDHLRVLLTSRQRLGLPGEREFPVAPLPVPVASSQYLVSSKDLDDPVGLATGYQLLATIPSVALFVDRAQAVRPDFQLTASNAVPVAGLCQRLEGLPLAIELAAARAGVLTPEQMLSRLEQRFELLVGRQRSADPRHRSLRAALDWSYQLLTPELQQFFTRLSVFRGGWTLEAAAAILDFGSPISDRDTGADAGAILDLNSQRAPTIRNALDCLEELQRCSLVVTEAVGEEMRYRLLETLREYGAEQLTAQERTALAQRHLDYYRARFENHEGMPGIGGRTMQQRLDDVEREQDNLRAALDWWVQSGAALDWMRRPGLGDWDWIYPLARFWWVRGFAPEGRQRLAEILALPGAAVPSLPRAWLLYWAGQLAHQQGDYGAAEALLQESRAIHQELGDQSGGLNNCRLLAIVARDQGDYAGARSFYEQALAIARERGDERDVASVLYGMGYTTYLDGDLGIGQSLLEESLQILRKEQEIAWARTRPGTAADYPYDYQEGVIHLGTITWAYAHRGEVADACGDYAVALAHLEESVAISRDLGSLSAAAYALHKLGRVAQHQGQWSAAAVHFCESLAFWQQDGNQQGIAACLEGLAAVASGHGNPEQAARLLGAAAALRESRRIPLPPVERADLERVIADVRTDLGEQAFAATWADGQALSVDQAIAEALAAALAG